MNIKARPYNMEKGLQQAALRLALDTLTSSNQAEMNHSLRVAQRVGVTETDLIRARLLLRAVGRDSVTLRMLMEEDRKES